MIHYICSKVIFNCLIKYAPRKNSIFVKIACWQEKFSTFWLTKPITITVTFTCHVLTYDVSFFPEEMFATTLCLFGLEQDGLGD